MSEKPCDVYTAITDKFAMSWPHDDDPVPKLGSANQDQDVDYDMFFDPESDEEVEV